MPERCDIDVANPAEAKALAEARDRLSTLDAVMGNKADCPKVERPVRTERPWQPPKWGCVTPETNAHGSAGLRNRCLEPVETTWCYMGRDCASGGTSAATIRAGAWFPTDRDPLVMGMCAANLIYKDGRCH